MKKVTKFNVETGEFTKVIYPNVYAWEWAYANNVDPESMFIIVKHSFDKKAEGAEKYQKVLNDILTNGLDYEGHHYLMFMASSGQLRNAAHTLIRADIAASFRSWLLCNVNDTVNAVANKTLVYRAVSSMSSSYKWEEATAMPSISIDNVAIFKDVESTVEGIFDEVTSGKVERKKLSVTNKITDGYAICVVDDEVEAELDAFTIRAPGFKGFTSFVKRSSLVKAIEKLGLNPIVKDKWGAEKDLRTLQLITFASVFKWCKSIDSWETYVAGFKRGKHVFRVCVKDHKGTADMPYQQFQTLQASKEDVDFLAQRSIDVMAAYDDPHNASHLLSKWMGKTARIYPDIFADEYTADLLQNAYASKRNKLAGGNIPHIAEYRFAAPDPVAVLQGLCGAEVTGMIAAKHVICNGYKPESLVDVTRSPHLDNAHCIRRVQRLPQEFEGLYTARTMYFSCKDATMNTLQMDFDGDHVCVSDNADIVRMALESLKTLKNVPLYYEAKGTKPGQVTKEDCINLLSNLEAAPVGLFANTLTKLWANGVATEEDLRNVAFLTEGGNTCIDAAKYISGNAEDMTNPGARLAMETIGKKFKKPMFLAYKKSSPAVAGSFEKAAANCRVYENSSVEQYSQRIVNEVPETLELDGAEEFDFRWKMLCNTTVGVKKLSGLFGRDTGLFNKLAYAHADEWRSVDHSELTAVDQFMTEQVAKIRKSVFAFGAKNGFSMQETVNALVVGCYARTKENYEADQLKRTLWLCFGEELYNNVVANLGKEIEDDNDEEFEDSDENEKVFFSDGEDCFFSADYFA